MRYWFVFIAYYIGLFITLILMRNWFLKQMKMPICWKLANLHWRRWDGDKWYEYYYITCCRTQPDQRSSQYIFCSHKQSSLLYGSFFRKLKPWTLQLFSLVRRIDRQAAAAALALLRLAGANSSSWAEPKCENAKPAS